MPRLIVLIACAVFTFAATVCLIMTWQGSFTFADLFQTFGSSSRQAHFVGLVVFSLLAALCALIAAPYSSPRPKS